MPGVQRLDRRTGARVRPAAELVHPDPGRRRKCIDAVKRLLDISGELGLVGPIAVPIFGKLADLFATEPEVIEAPDAHPLPDMQGAIDLEHVTFGYDPAVPVLARDQVWGIVVAGVGGRRVGGRRAAARPR